MWRTTNDHRVPPPPRFIPTETYTTFSLLTEVHDNFLPDRWRSHFYTPTQLPLYFVLRLPFGYPSFVIHLSFLVPREGIDLIASRRPLAITVSVSPTSTVSSLHTTSQVRDRSVSSFVFPFKPRPIVMKLLTVNSNVFFGVDVTPNQHFNFMTDWLLGFPLVRPTGTTNWVVDYQGLLNKLGLGFGERSLNIFLLKKYKIQIGFLRYTGSRLIHQVTVIKIIRCQWPQSRA